MIKPIEVKYLYDYKLLITFSTGEEKVYDAKHLLKYKIFEKLKNKDFFSTAKINNGSIAWNDELDIAPEELYTSGRCYIK